MLQAKTQNRSIAMRLVTKSGSGKFSLKYDKEREDDQVITYEDCKILLIDRIVSKHKGVLTIDFGGMGVSPRLIIVAR